MAGEQRSHVVVGVDGSPSSVAALRWALRYGAAMNCDVRMITAWDVPMSMGYPTIFDDVDWAGEARTVAEKALADTADLRSGVDVAADVVHGHPANVLVDAGKDAELLVVGSRGHGTAVGMLLGSVSQHCVHRAACPVVVVRAPAE